MALIVAGLGLAGIGTPGPSSPVRAQPTERPDPLAERLVRDIAPILEDACIRCHGPVTAWSGLNLTELTGAEPGTAHDLALWRETLDDIRYRVRLGEMPPPEEDRQLSRDDRDALLAWLDDAIGVGAPGLGTDLDPGWASPRRLNRDEYRFTMQDLLGIDPARMDLAASLPEDDLGQGLDTNADVLTLSTLHVEAYLDAAERAIDAAFGPAVEFDPSPRRLALSIEGGGHELDSGGILLYSEGAAAAALRAPAAGVYEITVRAWGMRGGDELPRFVLDAGDRRVGELAVEGTDAVSADTLTVEVSLPAGVHEIAARFVNDYYEPDVTDRNLAVESIEASGPVRIDPADRPPAYRRFVIEPDGEVSGRGAARASLSRFAAESYRRAPSPADIEGLLGLYDRERHSGAGHEGALRTALTAALVSPSFLFRVVESRGPGPEPLSGAELASRLAAFLWSSMPDGELRRLGALEMLGSEAVLAEQIDRMLADPRSERFLDRFAGLWLLLRTLDASRLDVSLSASEAEAIRRSMVGEVTAFFADAVRRNRPVRDLIDAPDVFIDERLARLYGLDGVRGERVRRVMLPQDSVRGGVLTTAAAMALTSHPTRTSPVRRGLYVLDQVLGAPPPPPPPDVPPLEQASPGDGHAVSARELLALHAADPGCASCHTRMDPIGLALDQFDTLGRWRETIDGLPIDASGVLPDGTSFAGPRDLKRLLLGREREVAENLAGRLLSYAVGRDLEAFDEPTVRAIVDAAEARGGGCADLVHAVVMSPAFRMSRPREVR
jgi:mono/diheme cytochrome c family protein